MGLETLGEVVEADGVGDLAGVEAAGEVLDAVGELVPLAVIFFGGGGRGGLDRVAVDD